LTAKVFALDTKPGIQRDGTVFDMNFYTDGQWVRFQRGRPRKMGGYNQMTGQMIGPSRGIYVNPQQGFTNIFNGHAQGLQVLPVNSLGLGAGVVDLSLSGFTSSQKNLWQFDTLTDVSGVAQQNLLLAHPGQNLELLDNDANTPVLQGPITGTSMSPMGVFTLANVYTTNGSPIVSYLNTAPTVGAGQLVTGSGIPANTTVSSIVEADATLSGVSITGTSGTFSCTATPGLVVGQSVTVGGVLASTNLASVAITGTSGTFSCTATTGITLNQAVAVTGTLTPTALSSVAVTGTAGQCSCSATTGLYVGQPVAVTGTLSGSETGIITNTTYYIVATNGTSTFTLSQTLGGAGVVTTAGTTTGLTFNAPLFTGVTSGTTYYITATNGTNNFTLSTSVGGPAITTMSNALTGLTFATVLDTGLTSGSTYYIITTNGSTTFTLSSTSGGSAIITKTNSVSGLTFITGNYTKITLSANATASAAVSLTFDNQISVSGGVVSLHPYVFVYGNNGLIKNSAAGNTNDWVSADANEVNVATGKIVQGLPVRGGSNSPSGLFWSLDSLIRVSYIGGTGTPVQYWRYDIVTSQSSILSSQSVIEYDGIYYWVGVDRFLMYNGVVKEVPNDFNQNYFFDNLNFAQRQKVWATKVPRFGEIWWFYPRGDATECTDAIIYNVRMNCWYDAGSAKGAQRSAGYFSQIFHYPVSADWNINYTGGAASGAIVNPGSGYTNGTYTYENLTGGTGTGAVATVVVAGGVVTAVTITSAGYDYAIGNLLSAAIPGGAGFSYEIESINSYVNLWQHEIGTDAIQDGLALAIPSFFETSDLGLVAGGPADDSRTGLNKWLRVERVEPDFIMSGEMECYITGRPYAQSEDKVSQPYIFDANTNKIDMKEQRRELRVGFRSNTIGGNYQLGRLLLDADTGDTRGY
jgi:hypothetical protein